MKCQHCEKPATFHITELTGSDGPKVLHLCEDHAREYLNGNGSSPATALSNMLAQQLKMDSTTKDWPLRTKRPVRFAALLLPSSAKADVWVARMTTSRSKMTSNLC